MRLKKVPITPVRLPNPDVELGAPPKRPPRVLPGGCVKDPVGFYPFDDVVVAGEQNALTGEPFPGLLEGERSELRNLPVHHAGEFVYHHARWRLTDDPRQVGPELLAVAQDRVWA